MSLWFWRRLSLLTGWAAVAVLFAFVVFSANIEIKDLDLWLHLATGQYILQHHLIPNADIFSCTVFGQPWINHEWLFQVIIFSVYYFAGPDGLIGLQVLIVTLTFLILLFLGYEHERQLGPIFVLLLVLLVYQSRLTIRPDIFSLFFLTVYIHTLAVHLNKKEILWILFFVQILWTNIHGFFIVGPLLVFINLIAEGVKRRAALPFEWNKVGRLTDTEFRRLKQLLVVVMAACLLNPDTFKGAWYPLGIFSSLAGENKIFFKYIEELAQPIRWGTLFSTGHYPEFKLLILVSFLSFVFNYRRLDIGLFFVWLFFLSLSLGAVRNMAFFALMAYLIFLINAQRISISRVLSMTINNERIICFCSIIFKVLLIVWMANEMERLSLRGYFDFDKFERKSEFGGVSLRNFPHKAVDFLVENNIKGNFFNDFNSGAYLIGRTFPNVKVFIDGRTEVYGGRFFERYRKLWQGDAGLFEESTKRYHLTGAFLNSVYVPAPEKLIKHLYESPGWVLVYFDYDAAIFLRDIPENKKWVDPYRIDLSQYQVPRMDMFKLGLRKATPYRYENRAYALFHMGFSDQAKAEAEEGLRIEPYNSRLYRLFGEVNIEKKEYETAYDNLRKAKLLDADDMWVRYYLAEALYHLGNLQQAKAQCQAVLGRKPETPEALFFLSLIHAKEKNYDASLKVLRQARQVAPEEAQGIVKVADLLLEQNEFQLAYDVYAIALEVDPDNAEIQEKSRRAAEQNRSINDRRKVEIFHER